MGALSWEREFIPVPIQKIANMEEACDSVHKKWEGTKKKNLKKHGLIKSNHSGTLQDEIGIIVDTSWSNCVWCHSAKLSANGCMRCPAVKAGMPTCAKAWTIWFAENNPQPMIDWVESAIEKIKNAKPGKDCK